MSQLPMTGEIQPSLPNASMPRYLRVRAALREEAESAAALSQSGGVPYRCQSAAERLSYMRQ